MRFGKLNEVCPCAEFSVEYDSMESHGGNGPSLLGEDTRVSINSWQMNAESMVVMKVGCSLSFANADDFQRQVRLQFPTKLLPAKHGKISAASAEAHALQLLGEVSSDSVCSTCFQIMSNLGCTMGLLLRSIRALKSCA